ncbi:hypothetical protein [Streptomyces sp. NPDC005732]|uniref:hypothetical protein n=1 Tax=Streptomyces sp. NPDC005732 TaxID=3157057 RepID=UPI0033C038E6
MAANLRTIRTGSVRWLNAPASGADPVSSAGRTVTVPAAADQVRREGVGHPDGAEQVRGAGVRGEHFVAGAQDRGGAGDVDLNGLRAVLRLGPAPADDDRVAVPREPVREVEPPA